MSYKSFVAILFMSGILFLLTGCAEKNYSGISIENREAIIEAIRTGLKEHASRITISFSAKTEAEASLPDIARALYEEALRESSDPTGGDYIRFQTGGYELRYSVSREKEKYIYTVRFLPVFYTTLKQEAYVTERVGEILTECEAAGNRSDLERIRFIHDYIASHVQYDQVHKGKENNHLKSTAYAALYYHEAGCQGYSVLAYRLLKELGIDTRVLTGILNTDGEKEYHAWNLVKLGSGYYNMDITLDAREAGSQEDSFTSAQPGQDENHQAGKEYFLRTDPGFDEDHIRDAVYLTPEFLQQYPIKEMIRP